MDKNHNGSVQNPSNAYYFQPLSHSYPGARSKKSQPQTSAYHWQAQGYNLAELGG